MISLQLLDDVSSGTGHLGRAWGSKLVFGDIHSAHYSAVNQMVDAHYFRGVSPVRVLQGWKGQDCAPVTDKIPAQWEHGSAL